MKQLLKIAGPVFLALHGLVHLMGFSVYLKLAEIEGLVYQTALFAGLWEVGPLGITIYGLLWIIPVVGFMLAGGLWLGKKSLPGDLLMYAAVFSLGLTLLDYVNAYAGILINILLIALLLLFRGRIWEPAHN